jgi:hypothetical protein
MLLTDTVASSTVTAQTAVLLPSVEVAVMLAVPEAAAVTTPLVSTVATALLLLLHFTVLSVAFSGVTVTVSVKLSPTGSVSEAGTIDTFETVTVSSLSLQPLKMKRAAVTAKNKVFFNIKRAILVDYF